VRQEHREPFAREPWVPWEVRRRGGEERRERPGAWLRRGQEGHQEDAARREHHQRVRQVLLEHREDEVPQERRVGAERLADEERRELQEQARRPASHKQWCGKRAAERQWEALRERWQDARRPGAAESWEAGWAR
jgi:hypothetical protein